jgi:hypothetical protein
MDFKNVNAEQSTITRDLDKITAETGNIYESLAILSERSNQLSREMKREVDQKIEEFSIKNEGHEDGMISREQIEVSKYYERLPKPHSIAVEELLSSDLYYARKKVAPKAEAGE